jgi:DNA primase
MIHAEHADVHSLKSPSRAWQEYAAEHAARCVTHLWADDGARAREYLYKRGLFDEVLRAFAVGYNPQDVWEDHAQWGLPPPESGRHRIWLPRGITFPWYVDGGVWRLNVRRPLTPSQIAAGEAKYIGPAGFANALYNAAALAPKGGPRKPVVLVEGEIDALTIAQAWGAGPHAEVVAVATGSTAGGRRTPWVARLALAPVVLVAFDWDDNANGANAGEQAAAWWLHALPNARRLRPLLHDVNSLPDPEDVRAWIARALRR